MKSLAKILSYKTSRIVHDLSVMPKLVNFADLRASAAIGIEFIERPDIDTTGAVSTLINKAAICAEEQVLRCTIEANCYLPLHTDRIAFSLGKNFAHKIDADILGTAYKFMHCIGSADVNLTEFHFLSAISYLEIGGARGPFVCVLHPYQVSNLRNAIAATTGATWGGPSVYGAGFGSMGSLYGVDIVVSTACPIVSSGRGVQGLMMPLGKKSGLGFVLKSDAKVTVDKEDKSQFYDYTVTGVYGIGCYNTGATGGVRIISRYGN